MQSLCQECNWFMEHSKSIQKVVGDSPTCLAFYPQPIPVEILTAKVSHDVRHPQQDNNLVYQPVTVFKKT